MNYGDIVYILNPKNEPIECIFSEYWNDDMVYIILENKSIMVQEKEIFKSKHEALETKTLNSEIVVGIYENLEKDKLIELLEIERKYKLLKNIFEINAN